MVVRLRPGSDGDATHVPRNDGRYTLVNPPLLYREKIAQQWMESRGEARPGVKYILESLPAGYSMWQRPRSDSRFVDKYLFGHPGKKTFDSPNRFYPHFEHLMNNGGSSIGCQCKVCAGSAGILPNHSLTGNRMRSASQTSASRPPTPRFSAPVPHPAPATAPTAPAAHAKGRPKVLNTGIDTSRVDEEGTPDVYRNLIDKLRRHNTIDEVIQEPLSLDWRAESDILPKLLQNLADNEQWVPRNGEIVLFVRNLPDDVEILRHDVTTEMLLYNSRTKEYLGHPVWEAGLVGQTPAKVIKINELTQNKDENTNVIYSGVRIEPLPNVNSANKSFSKQYKYVTLRQIRPLVFWKDLLHGFTPEAYHPTVYNALTVASTLSLVGKYRFRGTWPAANVYCHAMYIGAELLAVGDTIRLLPSIKSGHTTCSDIMVIKSIRLKWSNLDKASNNDYDEGRPYNSEIWVYGSAFTNDSTRANEQWLTGQNMEPPKAAAGYSQWFPLHPASKELAIPHTRVMGRLYEKEALAFYLNSEPENLPDLSVEREATVEGRIYSRQHDQRIAQEDATWYWGDDRADALNIKTINGLETSKFDLERDVKDWRKKISLIEGMKKSNAAANVETQTATATSFGGRDLRNFMAPGSLLASAKMCDAQNTSSSGSSANSPHRNARVNTDQKRTMSSSDGDDEEEIRQHTRVVEDTNATKKKRTKVTIVID